MKKATLIVISLVLFAALTACHSTDANPNDTGAGSSAGTDDVLDTTDATVDTIDTNETKKETAMINDVYAWVGYPASDFYVHFDDMKKAEKLT